MKNETTNEYSLPFAAWELRLYLDTHPNDEQAFSAYKKLCATQGCSYACNVIGAEENSDSCHIPKSVPSPLGCIPGSFRSGAPYQKQYSCTHNSTPRNSSCGRVWHWIDDPWPWEPEANVKGGRC